MMVNRNIRVLRLVGAGVMAAGLVAPAVAQTKGGDEFDKPLSAKNKAAAKGGQSTFMMREQDGDTRYEIRINDGQVNAKINGKDVPADRVVREGDQVRILDEDGKLVHRFTVVTGEGGVFDLGAPEKRRMTVKPAVPRAPQAPAAPQTWVGGEQPKVMLGINMGVPSETLAKNYGIQADEAILVDRVIDGLAADRAGLRENDIITEIDGKKPATAEALREALKDKEPGETVNFTVLRKGGSKTVRVKLDAFDSGKLAPLMGGEEGGENGQGWMNQNWEAFGQDGKANKEMQEALRKALKAKGLSGEGMVFGGPGGAELFIQPQMNEKMADLDKRMAELDERLAKLGEQMAKLEKMMDKMSRQHDKD